ncbi:MAG: M28 family peptidase [Flavobacteriales bacterium]|nr:M28 family peptidase [Flavobacteriales bacterium]
MYRSLVLPALSLALAASGQNLAPVVNITSTALDLGAATATITYDLSDTENDPSEVTLRASLNGGLTWQVPVTQVSGDVGAGILPGTGRTITWAFDGVPNIWEAVVMVVADDGHAPDIQTMVDQVDAQNLAGLLEVVAIPRHYSSHLAGIQAIRDTLLGRFNGMDIEVGTQDVVVLGTNVPNVIGRQAGLRYDTLTYIVDAHYDAVSNTPGADDNASGVVATLEIARILSQYRFRNSLRYIGFSFEEQGLIGSGYYVQSGIPAWERIDGVLNLEMIGYYSDEPNSQQVPAGFNILFPDAIAALAANDYRGDFLTVVGNTASNSLVETCLDAVDTYVPELSRIALVVPGNGQIAPDLRRSDHARFWDVGMKALMLTDGSEFRNANYHTPNDAIATLDIPFLVNCTKATLATAAMLAEPMNAGFDTHPLGSVGMDDHQHGFPCGVDVYPNPAKDLLWIHVHDCVGRTVSAQLFALDGRRVAGRDLRFSGVDERQALPLHGIARGTYLLVLQAGDAHTTLKVEVE